MGRLGMCAFLVMSSVGSVAAAQIPAQSPPEVAPAAAPSAESPTAAPAAEPPAPAVEPPVSAVTAAQPTAATVTAQHQVEPLPVVLTAHRREAPVTKLRWYGYLPLAADAAAIGILATTQLSDDDGFQTATGVLGVGTFVAGGPLVHALRGNWERAGISAGLRLGLPTLGVVYGAMNNSSLHSLGEAGTGLLIGSAAAIVVDAALVSWERVPVEPSIEPTFGLGRDQAWLGASGTF